jgi:hypothetical protein
MMRVVIMPALILATATIVACDPSSSRNEAAGEFESALIGKPNTSWESIAWSGQRHEFYHELSVEILRCIMSEGSSCRHPYLTEDTRFTTVIGGDMPGGWAYPQGMSDLAKDLGSFERYQYPELGGMPVPVVPSDPISASITLVSRDPTRKASLSFSYREGHLDGVSLVWMTMRDGKL